MQNEAEQTYEELRAEVKRLQSEGKLPTQPTRKQLIDFAYGNTKIENPKITRKIATQAVDELLKNK